MNWPDMRERALRFAGLFRRRRAEAEMDDELAFHLAMGREKYQRRGGAAAEAAAHAHRDLGSVAKWKDACRDIGRSRPIEDFVRDLGLAVRMLRKAPAFTSVALITLALAIGANAAIFSFLNALILRTLPVPHPERLAILRIQPDEFGYSFNYPLFKYIEQHGRVFQNVFAFAGRNLQVRGPNGVDRVAGQLVSGQYFPALEIHPELGRWIAPADDKPGTPDGVVAVITHEFWQRWFNGDTHVLGRRITLANVACTVIGVMPREFRPADTSSRVDVFVPFEAEPLVEAPRSEE